MLKYIMIISLCLNVAFSQSHKEVLKQIITNNNEIKSYKEYLNSVNIESRTNSLPLNPKIEYSYLKGSGLTIGNKQELIISQPFDFPTIYLLKSDISSLQGSANQFHLKEFEKNILKNAQSMLLEYIYVQKKVDELNKRFELAENMLKIVQIKFDKGDVGILELNKTKVNLSNAKSRLNVAKIELNSIQSQIINLNGGQSIQLTFSDYWYQDISTDFDSLFDRLKEADYYYRSMEEEKKLYGKKLSLAKTGWLPNFDIGYRQEREPDFTFKGVRLQMSIPIFENSNKVPKAESDISSIDLKIQSYISSFNIEKKRLYDISIQLKTLLDEQKGFVDYSQLELNKKSYELGHISLTQFYIDNTMFYEIIDSMLEMENEYNHTLSELMLEINTDF